MAYIIFGIHGLTCVREVNLRRQDLLAVSAVGGGVAVFRWGMEARFCFAFGWVEYAQRPLHVDDHDLHAHTSKIS